MTGAAGFVGCALIRYLLEAMEGLEVVGLDNLMRAGSELNRARLRESGVTFHHGDVRLASDFSGLPAVDWVIDAAASPSVLGGVDESGDSRRVIEHNLLGTVNTLEYCRRSGAGFLLISTSRVYSIEPLAALPVAVVDEAFRPEIGPSAPPGLSERGIGEGFSTAPPVSLYGASKLASETLALEYGEAYGFEVWINRCGVLAGAGQFGRADQGIFSFWIHSAYRGRPLRYIGFGGKGHQVRDCLHPRDLVPLLIGQLRASGGGRRRVQNVSGGIGNSMSLAQLTRWCRERFGPFEVEPDPVERPFDLPWLVLDPTLAGEQWGWEPQSDLEQILSEIADHAVDHPGWLGLSCS
ncbi:MAG: NAD-dependent epimerase/dehydratase family protein [Gemmatimonadota bacterium]|nr:NAD-dependent epimerase/dehydratase family protein [Gemmatimonadota bacterium]